MMLRPHTSPDELLPYMQTSLPPDDPLRLEHADAGMALLIVTLRLMHESGGSLTVSERSR